MSDDDKPPVLTNSERFLMAVAYLEATNNDDIVQASLIRKSMTEYDFTAGMTVLAQSLHEIYAQRTGEGKEVISFLRQFGNSMKLKEN